MIIVEMLAAKRLALGYPYSSAIQGSKYPLRELRKSASRHALRIFYAFDPERQAVLLIGGDKTGDNEFYKKFIPRAEKRWKQYLDETTLHSTKKVR